MSYIKALNVYPKKVTIEKGKTYCDAVAETTPPNLFCSDVEWFSDNTEVATVDRYSGHICARGEGKTQIFARTADGSAKSDSMEVTVINCKIYVTDVSLNKTEISLQKGNTASLKATVIPENATNKKIEWSSSNSRVASVKNGEVTANRRGKAYIFARTTDWGDKYCVCVVKVKKEKFVKSVRVRPAKKIMKVGESGSVGKALRPKNASNQIVKWSSTHPDIVAVNEESGMILAIKKGKAKIYATADNRRKKSGYCRIIVEDIKCVEKIEISDRVLEVKQGEIKNLSAKVYPDDAEKRTVRWISEDPKIATVNAHTGLVEAKSVGSTVIYACAKDDSGVYSQSHIFVSKQ